LQFGLPLNRITALYITIMTHLLVQKVEKKQIRKDIPEIHPGYTIKVYQKIKEGEKERIQVYEGLVIAMNHGHGVSKTMIVRKMVEGIGVEKIFPVNSPNIAKIEVVRIGKVRKSKLFYMRNISGKAARLREVMVGGGKYSTSEADATPVADDGYAADDVVAEETTTTAAPEVDSTEGGQTNMGI